MIERAAFVTGLNPYVAFALGIVSPLIGALLNAAIVALQRRRERFDADRAWIRQEMRGLCARYLSACNSSYNAAAIALNRGHPLNDTDKKAIDETYASAVTTYEELRLLARDGSSLPAAARALMLFVQGLVNAAYKGGTLPPDANAKVNALTNDLIEAARPDLTMPGSRSSAARSWKSRRQDAA